MNNLRKCFLYCIQKSHKPINLPHNEPIIVGRNKESSITDPLLSKNQLKLIANVNSCTVEVIPLGINPSGVNGFSLVKEKQYLLQHKDRLEFLLDKYIHEIVFEPEPKVNNDSKNGTKRVSDKEFNDITPKKLQKLDAPTWEEIDNKKLYIYTSENVIPSKKIAAYDLDGTIITTKSGARFPKDVEDWKFLYPQVPKKLAELHENGYKIVIFTNQLGIGLGKVKIGEFRRKIEDIVKQLKVPIQIFISTGRGMYRKPIPGMWNALCKQKNGVEIDLSASFYCGDAAGRPQNWAPKMKKDHSASDYLFAINIGVDFKTPEEHFLKHRLIVGDLPKFNPKNLKQLPLLVPETSQISSDTQEVVILVGSPASGKTFICKKYLLPEGYVHINRDMLGSWQKCANILETALQKNQKVVIDNTNPLKESRKRFIDITKKYNVKCRCFIMNTSIEQIKHNNIFREITDSDHQIITDIIINSYKKQFQEPTLDEGFSEIVKVNCNPTFSNPEDENLYQLFLLEK